MDFIEISAKTVDDAITEALVKLGTTSDKIEYEVLEKGSTGFLGFNSKPAVIRARKKYSMTDSVREFLGGVFRCMNLEVEIDMKYDEENQTLDIDLKGNDMGVLIGKRGQTLDSLQYLANLAANKGLVEDKVRIILDIENYRSRREDTLRRLAMRLADKVRRTGERIVLEPMNRHERKIIHMALQNNYRISTYSSGEEPYRKVVIELKRGGRRERRDRDFSFAPIEQEED